MPTTHRILIYGIHHETRPSGFARPSLYVDFDPPAPSTRVVRATILRLLARVEELTADGDRWIANEDRSTTRGGSLTLELHDRDENECERGPELLRRVAEEVQS